MNIWFISKYASTQKYAKAPSRLFCIAKETLNLGNEVSFITSDANHFASFPHTEKTYNFCEESDVPVCWIKTKKYNKTASLSRVLSWLDFEFKLFLMPIKKMPIPDVVFVSSLSIFTIIYGYYLKWKHGSFLIFEIRDIWPLTMTEEGGFSKYHPLVILIGVIEKFGYKKADLVVGTMPKLDLHVKNILGYEKPFYCLPLGFEPSLYTSEPILNKKTETSEIIYPQNKIIIGYAGSMGITNGLDPFIQAIKLMKNDDRFYFILVGSGDLQQKYIDDLIECSNVKFVSRIPQNAVKDFLSHCDILYLSTQASKVWEYGQSMNKVVEYMLAGKPIIASYSGYQSMINEANCGVFIPDIEPDSIRNAIQNYGDLTKSELLEIGVNGRKWIWNNRSYSHLTKSFLSFINATSRIKFNL